MTDPAPEPRVIDWRCDIDIEPRTTGWLDVEQCFPDGQPRPVPTAEDVLAALKQSRSKYAAIFEDWSLIDGWDISVTVVAEIEVDGKTFQQRTAVEW